MMYEDGFNIEEWKAKKLAERQETFAAQEEALKDVFASGQTLANYFYQRGRLGSHITAGNTALILRANPAARIRRTQFGRFEPEWLSLIVPDVDVDEVLGMPDITLQKAVLQIRPTMPLAALQKCLVQLAGETWRIKGFVRVPEGIFYVDCTGPEVRLTPWQGEADNRLVLLAGKGMQLRRTARTAVQWYNDYIEELSMR